MSQPVDEAWVRQCVPPQLLDACPCSGRFAASTTQSTVARRGIGAQTCTASRMSARRLRRMRGGCPTSLGSATSCASGHHYTMRSSACSRRSEREEAKAGRGCGGEFASLEDGKSSRGNPAHLVSGWPRSPCRACGRWRWHLGLAGSGRGHRGRINHWRFLRGPFSGIRNLRTVFLNFWRGAPANKKMFAAYIFWGRPKIRRGDDQ